MGGSKLRTVPVSSDEAPDLELLRFLLERSEGVAATTPDAKLAAVLRQQAIELRQEIAVAERHGR